MSDEEEFIDVNDEEDDESDTSIKEELIALVKANPALYAKNWKEYAGKHFCKDLAWESIGFNLSKPISGELHINHFVCLHVMMKLCHSYFDIISGIINCIFSSSVNS